MILILNAKLISVIYFDKKMYSVADLRSNSKY